MELILKTAEWLFQRSDPALVVCIMFLAVWQHRTQRTLARHLEPDPEKNPYPHPQCKVHEGLSEQMAQQHKETREDLQGLSTRIDTVLKIAVQEKQHASD